MITPAFQEVIIGLVVVLILAMVYVLGHRFETIRHEHKAHWLSFAGGVSIAYVFMHLLPELNVMLDKLSSAVSVEWLGVAADYRVYIASLTGFSVYYGLDRMVHFSYEKKAGQADASSIKRDKFRVNVIGYILYNFLIGYMVAQESTVGAIALILMCVVMSFHFLFISHHLELNYKENYGITVRLTLASSVITGWLVATIFEPPVRITVIIFSFIVGGIIVHTIKQDLPGGSESRFLPFLAGVVGISVIILLIYARLGH